MKTIRFFALFIGLALGFSACSPLDIDFNNAQELVSIQDEFTFEDLNGNLIQNNDLVELFGEQNIHFGPIPPSWKDSICFTVNGMEYGPCKRWIYGPNNTTMPSGAASPEGSWDGSIVSHLFYDQNQCVFKHKMETQDTYHNVHNMDLGKVYLIGHDSLFTTYYQGKIEDGNGNPTVIILISGTMAFDSHTGEFLGVKDYLFGKKILDYEYQPTQAFAPNTIEIKKHSGLSPKSEWIEQ